MTPDPMEIQDALSLANPPFPAETIPTDVPVDELELDAREWYGDRLREHMARLVAVAALGEDSEDFATPAIIRETHQMATTARLFQFENVADAAEALLESAPGDVRVRLDHLYHEIQSVLDARKPLRGLILLLDPDPAQRQVHRELLSKLNADILTAVTEMEAEEILSRRAVHLILMALSLPNTDGRDYLRRISTRPTAAGMAIITMADGAEDPAGEDTMAVGAEVFLRLPVNPNAFVSVIGSRLEAAIRRRGQSRIDPMTELPSRRVFCEEMERGISFAQRSNRPLSVALLSIDGLLEVYRDHGRVTGDALLAEGTRILRNTFRSSDTLARWSEDTFAACFPNTPPGFGRRAVEKALAMAAQVTVPVSDGQPVPLSFCAGIAGVSPGTVLEDLIARSIHHLQQARRAGPGQMRVEPSERGNYRLSVLIAENDRVTREVLAHRFRREGFEVDACEDGIAAMETALFSGASHTFFIIDAHIPRINGLDLVRRLRAMGKHARTPIILIDVANAEISISQGLALGANDYIIRPFSPLELMTRVRRLLRPS